MAQIGLKYLKYSVIDVNGNYTGSKTLGKAISSKVVPNIAEGKLYADDNVAESSKVVTGGTVDVTVDEILDTTYAEVLGHSYNESTKELVRNSNDLAPYVGFGRVITKMVQGVRRYKAEFLVKVQFKSSLPEEKTKGDSIEFSTPSLSGDLFVLDNGTWSKTAEFDTYEEAQEYLNDLMKGSE